MLILYIKKHAISLKDYRIGTFLSISHAHGDLCEHLGKDSSTDLDNRYSNLFLNAYINGRAHTEYLNMIEGYSPLGIWRAFLYSINTNIYHFRSMKYGNTRNYQQIDVYIYQCDSELIRCLVDSE